MSAPEAIARAAAAQNRAARPDLSVWVSANAGSGKTRVLTNRVARLLFDGAEPSRILCLTYTKAAAAEMKSRLFKTLGAWALAEDDALLDALGALRAPGEPPIARDRLPAARRLFASALETPGGLQIQTIHAFCETLLSRFPFEAGVSPHFSVLDDAGAAELLERARDAAVLARHAEPALRAALEAFVEESDSVDTFDAALQAAMAKREALAAADLSGDALADWLGLGPERTTAEANAEWAERAPIDRLRALAAAFASDAAGATARKAAEALGLGLAAWRDRRDADALADAACAAFLNQDGGPKQKLVTKALEKAAPGIADEVAALQAALLALEERRGAIAQFRRGMAAARLAAATAERMAAFKAEKAALDFDDLIARAGDLLTRSDARDWVRFKLDGGVQHILVDEAQDTSPSQWRVIQALAEDFFTGESAARTTTLRRTLFAVGDEKQSIYSFQGAAPEELGRVGAHLAERAAAAQAGFETSALDTSFRSSPEILRFVDAVFETDQARRGLVFGDRPVAHIAAKSSPGLVELWPLTAAAEAAEPPAWDDPVDAPPPGDPERALAREVAETIAGWIGRKPSFGEGAPIKAGDVLVLVRKRGAVSKGVIKRLKQLHVPVAGQDRLMLAEELAVRDLLALGRFVLNPEDDLALATLLRSPLCDVDEAQLFDLAHHRRGERRLFYALQDRRDDAPAFAQAYGFLAELLRRADFQRPFELFAHALGPMRGRSRLVGRLGPEAADPIDEFQNLALRFEAERTPSLEGFVIWAETLDKEIKREAEQGRDEVRVMTAHGAKGLEARIVVLPDTTGSASGGGRSVTVLDPRAPGAPPLWLVNAAAQPAAVAARVEAEKMREAEEHRRLFYVALTRAEERLLICGAARKSASGAEPTWHAMAEDAMKRIGREVETPDGRRIWRFGADPALSLATAAAVPAAVALATPAWLGATPPAEVAPSDIRPSALVDAAVDADQTAEADHAPGAEPPPRGDEAAARSALGARRGALIHRLLERGARATDREAAMRAVLAAEADGFSAAALEAMLREARGALALPEAAAFFGPNARAETPFTAILPELGPGEARGVIDILLVEPERVAVVDIKTGRPLDPAPEAYLRQLAIYARVAARLYPDRAVEAAILWTGAPRLAHIDARTLADALARAAVALDRDRGGVHL